MAADETKGKGKKSADASQTQPDAPQTNDPQAGDDPAPQPPATQDPAADLVADELVDTVTVTVPKAFKLRINNHKVLDLKPGVQEMDREHANHWYSKACGVVVYEPKKSAA